MRESTAPAPATSTTASSAVTYSARRWRHTNERRVRRRRRRSWRRNLRWARRASRRRSSRAGRLRGAAHRGGGDAPASPSGRSGRWWTGRVRSRFRRPRPGTHREDLVQVVPRAGGADLDHVADVLASPRRTAGQRGQLLELDDAAAVRAAAGARTRRRPAPAGRPRRSGRSRWSGREYSAAARRSSGWASQTSVLESRPLRNSLMTARRARR